MSEAIHDSHVKVPNEQFDVICDATDYHFNRPLYPVQFFEHIIKNTQGPNVGQNQDLVAVDLGCGSGRAAALLASTGHFSRVTGIDSGETMIINARKLISEPDYLASSLHEAGVAPSALTDKHLINIAASLQFDVSGAIEAMQGRDDQSIDLIIAGEAAHWFDLEATYSELLRVLKPGGSLAFYTKSGLSSAGPAQSAVHEAHLIGVRYSYTQSGKAGSVWNTLYTELPLPLRGSGWESEIALHLFDGKKAGSSSVTSLQNEIAPNGAVIEHFPKIMRKQYTQVQLANYYRTWTSTALYNRQHSDKTDIADVLAEMAFQAIDKGQKVTITLDVGLLLIHKLQPDSKAMSD